jgi:hypothetical protein
MIGLSNLALEKLLTKCKTFSGVFSCNNIPIELTQKTRFSLICNLSKNSEVGTHFVAIIAYDDYIIYVDSLGWSCFNADIINFLKLCSRQVFYNTQKLQAITSQFCGFYAALYVLHFEMSVEYQKMNSISFSSDLKKNDALCVKYVKRLLIHVNK